MKRVAGALALIVAVAVAGWYLYSSQDDDAQKGKRPGVKKKRVAGPRLPDQGMYDSCDPTKSQDGCESRLRRLSGAGFKVVVQMGGAQTAELPVLTRYADTAAAVGMKVMWQIRSRTGIPDATLIKAVGKLRAHPATWGYYIWDEPNPEDKPAVAIFAEQVKALDPTHPRVVVGCGTCFGGEGSVSFLADIDVTLGSDVYPVHDQPPDQPIVTKRVASVASGLQRVADRAGRRTVMVLQAWRWGDSHFDALATGLGAGTRFPTRREVEDQRNAAIANSRPDLILWFRLEQTIGWEPGQGLWYWSEPTDAGQRWANVVGGAFAPSPTAPTPKPKPKPKPVARFTLRSLPVGSGVVRAAGGATRRIKLDGGRSSVSGGRIVRYRWYASGRRRAVCTKRRCSFKLRRAASRKIKLTVTDQRGAKASVVRRIPAARR